MVDESHELDIRLDFSRTDISYVLCTLTNTATSTKPGNQSRTPVSARDQILYLYPAAMSTTTARTAYDTRATVTSAIRYRRCVVSDGAGAG